MENPAEIAHKGGVPFLRQAGLSNGRYLRDTQAGTPGTNLVEESSDQEDRMNLAGFEAVFRRERPDTAGPGGKNGGNVKFFLDKGSWKLYPPRFIFDGPTLRG